MCGRYGITEDPESWSEVFKIMTPQWGDFVPRYNIAPSEPPLPANSERKAPRRITHVPIIRQTDDGPVADNVIWPLIPVWAKGEVPKYSTANARSEDMAEKNSYKRPWNRGQRCLMFATHFYEWQAVEGETTKQPWAISTANEACIFGGLWETSWKDGKPVNSCTIVTLEANDLMREIHNAGRNKNRMPLIVPGGEWETWLSGSEGEARDLIYQYPADEMKAWKVSRELNNSNYDKSELLREDS